MYLLKLNKIFKMSNEKENMILNIFTAFAQARKI